MQSRLQVFHAMTQQLRNVLPEARITHLRGMALLLLGVAWSRQVGLAGVAAALPLPARAASTERRLRRWLANHRVTVEQLWRPQRRWLLERYRDQEITLVFDPTPFRGTFTLLCVGIVHGRRVLPLDTRVMPQQDGWGQTLPSLLDPMFQHLAADLPAGCTVTLVADRGFVGPGLVDCCAAVGWQVVQRLRATPGDSTRVRLPDGTETTIAPLVTRPGQRWSSAVTLYKAAGWRAGYLTIRWERGYAEPWVLFSTRSGGWPRVREYKRRTRVEATYQDLKSRGLQLEGSRLQTKERLERLFLVVTLAFWWVIGLGDQAIKRGNRRRWERADRRELSQLTLGYRVLADCEGHQRMPPLLFPQRRGHAVLQEHNQSVRN
jgi:hypothetical protein